MRRIAKLGVGTYRFASAEHEACLRRALAGGFRVVDCSPNYGNGNSESLVGNCLRSLSELERSRVEVVSKFGFVQGSALDEFKRGARSVPDAVEYTENCFYSIHPNWMNVELGNSIQRLGKVDTYLVHNPEHILINQLPPETSEGSAAVQQARERLSAKLITTFQALEGEIEIGRISRYGVSSNSLSLPMEHPHFVPVELLLDAASKAASNLGKSKSSFQVVELTGNLLERAALCPVAAGGNGAAQTASKAGVRVFVNRALTAFDNLGSWRLAESDFPEGYAKAREELISHLSPDESVAAMSKEEQEEWRETLEASRWLRQLVNDLDAQVGSFSSVMHYQDDLMRKIIPMINSKLDGMDDATSNLLFVFFQNYEKAVRSVAGEQTRNHVFESISKDKAMVRIDDFAPPKLPDLFGPKELLQDMALAWLRDHPHVDTVLLGAVREEYVDHAIRVMSAGQK